MAGRNNTTKPIHQAPVGRRMLTGAAIALILIIAFLFGADTPDPYWPKLWIIKPLIIVPAAGAMGGLFYHLMDSLRYQGGWKRILANILSLLVYIIALWMGTVLGLNGTYWD